MLGGFLRTFPSSCLCGLPEGALLGLTAVGDGLALALCWAYTAQKEALEFLSLESDIGAAADFGFLIPRFFIQLCRFASVVLYR